MQVGQLISDAMARVGRQGVVTMEESRTAEDHLYVVEGMQFDRGYISPYFVTDPERMVSIYSTQVLLRPEHAECSCPLHPHSRFAAGSGLNLPSSAANLNRNAKKHALSCAVAMLFVLFSYLARLAPTLSCLAGC